MVWNVQPYKLKSSFDSFHSYDDAITTPHKPISIGRKSWRWLTGWCTTGIYSIKVSGFYLGVFETKYYDVIRTWINRLHLSRMPDSSPHFKIWQRPEFRKREAGVDGEAAAVIRRQVHYFTPHYKSLRRKNETAAAATTPHQSRARKLSAAALWTKLGQQRRRQEPLMCDDSSSSRAISDTKRGRKPEMAIG